MIKSNWFCLFILPTFILQKDISKRWIQINCNTRLYKYMWTIESFANANITALSQVGHKISSPPETPFSH